MNQKVMRLVRKEKQPKHRGLLKTDEILRPYQDAYNRMAQVYRGGEDDKMSIFQRIAKWRVERMPFSRRLLRWIRGVR